MRLPVSDAVFSITANSEIDATTNQTTRQWNDTPGRISNKMASAPRHL